jgi:uncharacterized RDD family membrane protein YckC
VPVLTGVIPYVYVVVGLIDIALIFRRDRRCLHDLIARTKVVAAARSPAAERSHLTRTNSTAKT